MSLVLDGSNGVTFPNGSNPQAAPCKVLQVVQAYVPGSSAITSTSYVATSLTATITPLFSTSKILVMMTGIGSISGAGSYMFFTIYRNSTNIAPGATQQYFTDVSNLNGYDASIAINYLDSPATTSATTYTLYTKVTAGNGYIGDGTSTNTLILMEIAQ